MVTTCFRVLLCLLAVARPAVAQFETAALVGTVTDGGGALVTEATITVTNTDTGVSQTRQTSATGSFEFTTLRIGTYVVTAEKPGFATALADDVRLTVGARQRVDMTLQVGQVSERVEVTAFTPLLQTDSSDRSQVITGEQTRALPLNGREYSSLALLTTGVRLSALNTGGLTPREGSFNVNGLRSTFNNFLIDGVDNNAYGTSNQGFSNQVMQPSPDAVAEFKVVTNNMSAEYGRSAGATINVAYASGTNQLRGSGWEFVRDTTLNATGFFKPPSGEKPPLERHQFGGVVGGPVVKNRAFFFADFERFHQTRGLATSSTIATLAQRQGIFAIPVRNPLTGEIYQPGTPVPMTAFARKVLNDLPAPTNENNANNYVVLQEFENTTDKFGGKVDVTISPTMTAFGRFGYRDADIFDNPPIPLPSGGGGNAETYVTNKQIAAGMTYIPSATSLVEMRFGWSRTTAGKNPAALGTASALDAYGISGLPTDARVSGGLPTQVTSVHSDLGRQATNPQWQYPEVFNPKVNYTWIRGRQSLKSGYEFQHIRTEVQDVNPLYGRDTYNGQFTDPLQRNSSTLYNLADFMLGLRSQYALSNILVANLRQNMHFAYVQDDVRVNDRLTLNVGLRYEYATPWVERDNILSNWDPDSRTMVLARDGSLEERATITPDRNNFGPRLGLAYTMTPSTVIRGGYGVSYVHFHRAGGANVLPINGPQVINAVVTQSNPLDPSFRRTEQGYPEGFTDPSRFNPLTANITYMPKDYRSSQVQSWFASVQREFGRNLVVDLAYVGNRGDDLLLFANFNQAAPNVATAVSNSATSIPIQQRRPIQGFADITYSFNGGKSRYHAFQSKLEWRMGAELMLLNSLTLSQTKDNGAGSLENPNGNFPAPQDFHNLEADFALSAYHQPYNNTTSLVWNLPFQNPLAGGWQLAAINSIYAGEPVTFIYSPTPAFQVSSITQDFRGANNYRPNVIGDPYAPEGDQTIANWFNRLNVVIPTDPSQPFGNAARNSVRGPMFWQTDLAVSRIVPLGRRSVELRAELFNLFNRSNFRAPNGNRSAAAFGTITQTYDPRQVQLGVKVNF